ncbi:uncharacterized protein LOC143883870 [Tasmannia lanceolata]|uniref:uncharacterized protein LOC143883870 n=1 Tax=Tasmannia lanceolata TaxID=3420 RepID=UPI00406451AF
MASEKQPEAKKAKLGIGPTNSQKSDPKSCVGLNPADCNLDFNVEGNGLQGRALCDNGFAYCWSGARGIIGITGGKYCFGCKVISEQTVNMEDTPVDQQHVCRVGISRGDDEVGNLGESAHSFGFGGTGKFSNSGKFSDYGTKFGVGDTIVCAVDLETRPLASIGFSKNGKWLGIARQFDAGPRGLGVVNCPVRKLPWECALFPHVLLKNVVVQVQFGVDDGLVPEEGYKPWSSAIEDGNAIMGPSFSSPKDCEVLMMVGLPASGKSTWAEKWVKEHPEKRYVLLGTNLALEQMKVPGLLRKQNYGERFDRLMDRATLIFNTLLARAAKTPRNYILDQTNVYKGARKRKIKPFVNYQKIAVVVFPTPDELKFRAEKRFKEMGKEVPADAVNEMLANYVLPMSKDMPGADEFFDEVIFPELNRGESQRHLDEMKRALGSTSNLNTKSDFSLYSRESSVQSFNSPSAQNREALSAVGRHWQNSPSSLPPPRYDLSSPQQVSPAYSGIGLYGKPEVSSGGHRSVSGDPSLSLPRDDSYGNYSNYGRSSLPRDNPDPYGSYGGFDRYSIRDFESPRGSVSYNSPGAHLGDPRMNRTDLQAPTEPPFEHRSPFSNTYGSPRGVTPPMSSPLYGNSPFTLPPRPLPSYRDSQFTPPRPLPSYGDSQFTPPRPLPPYGYSPISERRQSDGYPPSSRYY